MADFRDRIYLKDLRVACIIGVRPEERTRKQEIAIDVCLHVDLEQAGRSDKLEHTVDYSRLASEIVTTAEGSSFQLLERLAEEVAAVALAHFGVERVEVRIAKPHALPRGREAAVEIIRDRDANRRPMGFGRLA